MQRATTHSVGAVLLSGLNIIESFVDFLCSREVGHRTTWHTDSVDMSGLTFPRITGSDLESRLTTNMRIHRSAAELSYKQLVPLQKRNTIL